MKICPNCNFSNKDNAKFCANCGSTLVNVEVDEGIYCPNCHTKVDSFTSRCPYCGTIIDSFKKENSSIKEFSIKYNSMTNATDRCELIKSMYIGLNLSEIKEAIIYGMSFYRVVDANGDKNVSLDEILINNSWRIKLLELIEKGLSLNGSTSEDLEFFKKQQDILEDKSYIPTDYRKKRLQFSALSLIAFIAFVGFFVLFILFGFRH